jgi:hypothetical protein
VRVKVVGSLSEVGAWVMVSSSHSPCIQGRGPMVRAAQTVHCTARTPPPGTQPLGRQYTLMPQTGP